MTTNSFGCTGRNRYTRQVQMYVCMCMWPILMCWNGHAVLVCWNISTYYGTVVIVVMFCTPSAIWLNSVHGVLHQQHLRGLDNPSRPRPCCTLACRCGRGPTQGTCKRELTAEGLLPSMRIWMRIIFMSWETQHRAAVAPPGVATTLTAYNDMFSIIRKKTAESKQHFHLGNFVFLVFCFFAIFCFGGIASYWETRRFPVVFSPNPSFDDLGCCTDSWLCYTRQRRASPGGAPSSCPR